MPHLLLYTTEACHLCEQAVAIIQPLLPEDVAVELIDISESDALIERYGVRIPVIADSTSGRELGWPFDAQQFLDFLQARY